MRMRQTYVVLWVVLGILSTSALAYTPAIWIDGNVTRAPWRIESHYYVEVDSLPYRILLDIRVSYRYLRNDGAYDEEVSNVYSIVTGQKIWMKVRENDVEQIILF